MSTLSLPLSESTIVCGHLGPCPMGNCPLRCFEELTDLIRHEVRQVIYRAYEQVHSDSLKC